MAGLVMGCLAVQLSLVSLLLCSPTSTAQHTLGTGSSLAVEDRAPFLVSPDGNFSCGFIQVGCNAFSSVWFTAVKDSTVVWTANSAATASWPSPTPTGPRCGRSSSPATYYSLYFDNDNVLRMLYDGPEIASIYWPLPEMSVFDEGRTNYNSSRIAILDDAGVFGPPTGCKPRPPTWASASRGDSPSSRTATGECTA
ncbi:hypothetical protein E2562_002079 [Oryza meyeriana var. granulata]|uniref:Bulb-type lectin domain-containing protein n=1 Tax=Oryza meyeriana var. granulata TaxID=110450 RepID=A0A6G1EDL2_9ORYZ|nr:hypothetical protein E2562_002079 [Oryza meyeriana var. granulata]